MLDNFGKIFIRKNVKEIRNVSIVLSGIVAALVFSSLYIRSKTTLWIALISSSTAFGYMLASSYVLYKIFSFCSLYFTDNLFKSRLVRYSLSYFSGFIVFLSIYVLTDPLTGFNEGLLYEQETLFAFIVQSIICTSLIMIFHNFVFIQLDRNKTKLENANLKVKTAEAVTLLLKQQIHPHFLFNSLHTIKVLYKDDAQLGEEYLVQLADFLRTTVSNTQAVSATLEEELRLFENYLNMQKMRFGEALDWQINIENPEHLKKHILAFSLQPLAENAIKHNHFTTKVPLVIVVEQKRDCLTISNGINKKKYTDQSIGSGLANLAERYQIWSGDELEIENDGSTFLIRFNLKAQ